MKGRLVVGINLLALSLVGWSFLGFASYTWNQKMTVEVEVNGQVYAGSSVVEMSVFGHPPIPLVQAVRDLDMRGEAVVVELPGNRYLFVLLTYNAFLARDVFKETHGQAMKGSGEQWASVISELRETRDIAPKDYPQLVTFTDITDPKTVKQVDPENLAAPFGPGVSLRRMTLEITDEDVTEGKIQPVLKWLDTVGNGMLDGRSISTIRAENRLANDLSRLDFKKGN